MQLAVYIYNTRGEDEEMRDIRSKTVKIKKKINIKKVLLDAIFFALVFLLTIYGIFHGEDMSEVGDIIKECNVAWLIPAVVCVFAFISGESIILWYLFRSFGIKIKERICLLFSSVGFFFSCVTPSASGGQPMQLVFMKKKKIPMAIATVILMLVTILYKLVLVITGVALVIFARGFLNTYIGRYMWIFYLGIVLNVGCVALMLVVTFHQTFAGNLVAGIFKLMEKIHILKHNERRNERVARYISQYNGAAAYIKEHIGITVHMFIITVLQRFAMFLVTYFVYRAFSLSGTKAITIVLLQAAIAICVDMLPLPGGMGISEALFKRFFATIFGAKLLLPGLVLSRGLGYYSELIMSAVLTIVAMFVIKENDEDENI